MRALLWSSLVCASLVVACRTVLTPPVPEAVPAGEAHSHDLTQVRTPDLCAKCHQDSRASGTKVPSGSLPGSPRFTLDGVAMCTQCHEEDVSHMIGVAVDFPVPGDLPLSEDGTVTCLTCHKAHGPLHADRPWANVTVIDRWLNTGAMRKTYLLRRNNEHGELCLVCHDTPKE